MCCDASKTNVINYVDATTALIHYPAPEPVWECWWRTLYIFCVNPSAARLFLVIIFHLKFMVLCSRFIIFKPRQKTACLFFLMFETSRSISDILILAWPNICCKHNRFSCVNMISVMYVAINLSQISENMIHKMKPESSVYIDTYKKICLSYQVTYPFRDPLKTSGSAMRFMILIFVNPSAYVSVSATVNLFISCLLIWSYVP